eukprot:925022_1
MSELVKDSDDRKYTNLLQTCGIGYLVQMLQQYLDRMKLQDKVVELYFTMGLLEANMIDTLRKAKAKSTKLESSSGAKSKGIERAFYKTFYVYNGDFKRMLDMLRCSFVFDNFEDLYNAVVIFDEYSKSKCDGILRIKDRFEAKTIPFGYRDLMINTRCPNSKIICEIQFHHSQFYKLKKPSHAMYKKARLFEYDGKNDAYEYAQIHIRPNKKDATLTVDDDAQNDDDVMGMDLHGLETADNESIDKLSNHTIARFKELNYGPSHIKKYLGQIEAYLSDVRKTYKKAATYKSSVNDYRLYGTELDDVDIYKHAQLNIIDKFPYGQRLTLDFVPMTVGDFTDNFQTFCKYGLNSLIVDYLEESSKDYTKILNDLFDENDGNTVDTVWDRHIIDIIIEYLKAPFGIVDLLKSADETYKESGMTLAAKYGQSATVEIIIQWAKRFGVVDEVVNHSANGGTPLFWLFRCYSPDVFNFLDNTNSIRPTMMLLLKNGASIAPAFRVRRAGTINVVQLARLKKKSIDADILEAYSKYQQKEAASPMEYAKQQNNADVVDVFKLYHVQ